MAKQVLKVSDVRAILEAGHVATTSSRAIAGAYIQRDGAGVQVTILHYKDEQRMVQAKRAQEVLEAAGYRVQRPGLYPEMTVSK